MNKKGKSLINTSKSLFTVFEKENISYLNVVCGFIVFAATFYYTMQMPLDYGAHLQLAGQFSFSHLIASITDNSYPLWHICCVLIWKIFNIPGHYAAAFTSAGFVLITYYVSRKIIVSFVHNDFGRRCASVFSAMLMFVQPIYIPWFNESQVFGQGSPNILYNPTTIAVKPFAIICVWLFVKICVKSRDNGKNAGAGWIEYIQLAFFQFVSVLAKPSFAQVCIPAVGVYLIYSLIKTKGRSIGFCLKTVLSWVPGVLWMAMIFYLSFISSANSDGNGVAFSFFDVWSVYSPCVPVSVLLTTLFPIAVLLVALKNRKDGNRFGLYLSALMVVFGVLEYGFLMETGDRMMHGNFSWGYIVGLGVVWTYATSMLVAHLSAAEEDARVKNRGWALACLFFAAHFIFGVYYYIVTL